MKNCLMARLKAMFREWILGRQPEENIKEKDRRGTTLKGGAADGETGGGKAKGTHRRGAATTVAAVAANSPLPTRKKKGKGENGGGESNPSTCPVKEDKKKDGKAPVPLHSNNKKKGKDAAEATTG